MVVVSQTCSGSLLFEPPALTKNVALQIKLLNPNEGHKPSEFAESAWHDNRAAHT